MVSLFQHSEGLSPSDKLNIFVKAISRSLNNLYPSNRVICGKLSVRFDDFQMSKIFSKIIVQFVNHHEIDGSECAHNIRSQTEILRRYDFTYACSTFGTRKSNLQMYHVRRQTVKAAACPKPATSIFTGAFTFGTVPKRIEKFILFAGKRFEPHECCGHPAGL